WASNSKYAFLGAMRSAAQIVAYEIAMGFALVGVLMAAGSLNLNQIVLAQQGNLLHWFWLPLLPLFLIYFISGVAETNRAPFDMAEAESELVAGYSTEYSGMRYLFFFFAEWANVFVFCGIASALFLGGWQVPGFSPADLESNFGLQILGTFLFLLKSWILIFVVIWIRWTLPRVRIDQLMNLCWKWFVPLSFLAFLLTALWVMGTSASAKMGESGMLQATAPLIPTMVQLVISVGTFAVFVWLCVYFAKRVSFNVRASKIPVHLNPFL
ncbi:MAG: NADH-quinone oxidoreductase subunit H, partial [Myxococcales bacterium]|nr:NADH-quinone oxidoreductase subunit H [Myxococcales bacterium]